MNNQIINNEIKNEIMDSTNNFEEVLIFHEPKSTRTDSYFDGTLIELIGW